MKARDIKIGRTYTAKVSGSLTTVKVSSVSPYGGWTGVNTVTGREVRIKSAQRLRHEIPTDRPDPKPAYREEPLHAAYTRLKQEDPGRVLLFEADTTASPTILVFNGDIDAIEAAGVSIASNDRAEGVSIVVASIPRERIDAVVSAVRAAGGRLAIVRRVVGDGDVRSEVRA